MSQSNWQMRLIWLCVIVALGVFADQASKHWAQNRLAHAILLPSGEKQFVSSDMIVVVPNAFNLIYKENPAAAFSITSSLPDWFRRPFLILVSLFATIFFLVWYFRMKEKDGLLVVSFCLVMTGAIGNFIDRVQFGYVVDFLDVYAGFLGYPWAHWPTFNIADSCIVAGAIGILLRSMWPKQNA